MEKVKIEFLCQTFDIKFNAPGDARPYFCLDGDLVGNPRIAAGRYAYGRPGEMYRVTIERVEAPEGGG